ncbi:MAG TPA: RiPP maturation radical SAM C-methyltransferase, partial [Streptosporangiaceae bacterium]|nr:RiPP maturation radical SAM C-methyltransferase [Streptosporangiaceae bacterium]
MTAGPVVLATMPWQSLDCPSLPIALLNAAAAAAGFAPAAAYHGNLHWAEFLLEATGGEIGPPEYTEIADNGLFDSLGDWAFTGVLHDDDLFGVATLHEYARDRGVDTGVVERMREHARDFVDAAAARILAAGPAVVGFTSTFMQNVPSLATARRVRELDPRVRIVFGGGNCDGVMGTALHRSFPFVDFVVRGEGETAWPALLAALAGDRAYAGVPGLCWRDGTGVTQANGQAPPLPAGRIPAPDYTSWFEQLAVSPVSEYVEPKLVLESARGCWWGEKHHCTFCGLNGTLMPFRAKSPERVLDEITSMVLRHQVLDVIMVDNIISERSFDDLLPRLAGLGWDLRIHYEVKSNLRPSDIALLRESGVMHVQPGIESLVTPALRLMDKGVTGIRNLRTLRDCESAGLTVTWNW